MLTYCDCGQIRSADQEMCKECREIENRNKKNFTRHLARSKTQISEKQRLARIKMATAMVAAKKLKNANR